MLMPVYLESAEVGPRQTMILQWHDVRCLQDHPETPVLVAFEKKC